MSDERPTLRPVGLVRLAETSDLCQISERETSEIVEGLSITHRRARETILEARRLNLIEKVADREEPTYTTTTVGRAFVDAIKTECWFEVNMILEAQSPHYSAFLSALYAVQPADLEVILAQLKEIESGTSRQYNQTSVDVLSDWAERLEVVQRNAFSGEYYIVDSEIPTAFTDALLTVYDDLEEVAGVSLRQRYLSIPELREHFCTEYRCQRDAFDEAVLSIATHNIGKLELSGAPIDTSAKESPIGIKSMEHTSEGDLVSTSQSTERVMAGVEQRGKHYYFLAIFDRDLDFFQEDRT